MILKLFAVSSLSLAAALAAEGAQKGKKASKAIDPARTQATIQTDLGDITIRFFPDKAPHHVQNFLELAANGVYDGVLFHRVIPNFMIQTGDPLTKNPKTPRELMGRGSYFVGRKSELPGFVFIASPKPIAECDQYSSMTNPASIPVKCRGVVRYVKAEFNDVSHKRGIVSMARAPDPNSASSQFFIVVKDSPSLDHQYTAFGEVTKGLEVADKIAGVPRDAHDNPMSPIHVRRIAIAPLP